MKPFKAKIEERKPSNGPANKFLGFVPVVPTVAESTPALKVACNCKNSQCIKLYCDCFRNGTFCQNCNCENCLNKTENPTRTNVINMIRQKNPSAFEPKFRPNKDLIRSLMAEPKVIPVGNPFDIFLEISRGCNCKNSNCNKKYCECFQNGIECSYKCKCVNCHNGKSMRANLEGPQSALHAKYMGLEEAEIKSLLVNKLLEIKQTRFPKEF